MISSILLILFFVTGIDAFLPLYSAEQFVSSLQKATISDDTGDKPSFTTIEDILRDPNIPLDSQVAFVKGQFRELEYGLKTAKETAKKQIEAAEERTKAAEKQIKAAEKETKVTEKAAKKQIEAAEEKVEAAKEKVEAAKEKTETTKEENERLQLEISNLKAKYTYEVNLRPKLEEELRNWWGNLKKTTKRPQPGQILEKLVKDEEECLMACVRRVKDLYQRGDYSVQLGKDDEIFNLMLNVYKTLSYPHHRVSENVKGYIVGGEENSAIAASALFVFFGVDHTMMNFVYDEILYKWALEDGCPEECYKEDNMLLLNE